MAFSHWQSNDPVKFVCYLIAALLASSLKVRLPGIEGTLSVNFLFTLLGILELSLPETLLIGWSARWRSSIGSRRDRLKLVQLVFNLSQVTVSSAVAYGAYKFVVIHVLHAPRTACPAGGGNRPLRLQHSGDVDHHRLDGR